MRGAAMGRYIRSVMKMLGLLALTTGLAKAVEAAPVVQFQGGKSLSITTSRMKMECDLASGRLSWEWPGGPAIRGASCAARLADGSVLAAGDYEKHEVAREEITPLADDFGKGMKITLHHRAAGRPELRQEFRIYEGSPFFFVTLEVVGDKPLASNYLAPLVIDNKQKPDNQPPQAGLRLDAGAKPTVLFVPFDNDNWARYNGDHDPAKDPDSYEVTAIYDANSRHGFVLGSVTHDVWKTGIEARALSSRSVGHIRVYGGAAGPGSRDSQPHGMVSGATISSPRIFVGCFSDWRDGMEAFGRACARVQPPLAWSGGVPFGWNSWAAYGMRVDLPRMLAVSDFIAKELQPRGFGDEKGAVYLNWDSGWNKLSEAQLVEGVRRLHVNGQKAGIYMAPFGYWGDNLDRAVEGTQGRYRYRDIVLRGADGQPLPKLDGAYRLDPTHPAIIQRVETQVQKFVEWGYEYVKIDFLNFPAAEGRHYDPKITTGIQAYNAAMTQITRALAPQKIGRPIFISLSIAPLFPGGCGHARRVSCDAFGQLKDTEYLLNSVTYGWWMNGTLQAFNDPDHIVLYNRNKPETEAEARSRVNASVIAGTVMIDSDDLRTTAARERAKKLLANPEINALARGGHSFRPVEADGSSRAADIFEYKDATGPLYLALFNYDGERKATKRVDLGRVNLGTGAGAVRVHDLWTKDEREVKRTPGVLEMELGPGESKILRLSRE